MWTPVRDYERRAPLYRRALALLERGCRRGDAASCASAVAMYRFGEGAEPDEKRATEMEQRAATLRRPRLR